MELPLHFLREIHLHTLYFCQLIGIDALCPWHYDIPSEGKESMAPDHECAILIDFQVHEHWNGELSYISTEFSDITYEWRTGAIMELDEDM